MSGETDSPDTARGDLASAAKTVWTAVSRAFVGLFALGYLALWGALAMHHYGEGDLVGAATTLVVFVGPFVGAGLYRVTKAYGTPDVGTEGTPSLS